MRKLIAFLIIGVSTQTLFAAPLLANRELREIEMANQAIQLSLMVSRNPESRLLCSTNYYACLGPDEAELGLALLASRHTTASTNALISVLRYKIDGGLSEDFSCYVLQRKKKILFPLKGLMPTKLIDQCKQEFRQIKSKNQPRFDKLESDDICATGKEIQSRIASLQDAISRSATCNPEEF